MSDPEKRAHSGDPVVRKVLTRAGTSHEPRIDGLLAAVPAMMAEAHHRRRLAQTPAARISRAASSWLPRMAATAALLVAIALLWPAQQRVPETAALGSDAQSALDSWVVTGSSPSGVQDPVMDALVR